MVVAAVVGSALFSGGGGGNLGSISNTETTTPTCPNSFLQPKSHSFSLCPETEEEQSKGGRRRSRAKTNNGLEMVMGEGERKKKLAEERENKKI